MMILSSVIPLLGSDNDDDPALDNVIQRMGSGETNVSLEWLIEAPHGSGDTLSGVDFQFSATEAMGDDTIIAGWYTGNSTLGDWNIKHDGTSRMGFVGKIGRASGRERG